jgi:uncharacterized protein
LCPFAKAVHVKHQIRYAVTAATTIEELLEELQHELEMLNNTKSEIVDTTSLIHPHVMTDFWDFRFFLKTADGSIKRLGHKGRFQIASFHLDYEFRDNAHGDSANNTNRSPHPMLHLLREASIDRAVTTFPDAATIYERNIETLRALGQEGWQRLWANDGD